MIQQSKPYIQKSDFAYIDSVIRSSYIAQGRLVDKLQKAFCKMHNIQYSYATSCGTAALHLALVALGVKEDDEVIIPSYTCVAVLNAINYCRAHAKIVDIDPETLNITYKIIRKTITRKTKAIIVTHTFGFPADVDEIAKIGIPIIEDCAQALGARYKKALVGTRGKVAVYSMYATKMITCGEGGMVCTNDKKIANNIFDLNTQDMRNDYRVRYNYKMSDLTAGLALSQLNKIDSFLKRRISIAAHYETSFASLPIKLQRKLSHTVPNFYRFIIITSQAEKIIRFTNKHGVMCDKPVYKSLHHYLKIKNKDSFLGTDFVWKRGVSIPIYPAMKDEEFARVIHIVSNSFR